MVVNVFIFLGETATASLPKGQAEKWYLTEHLHEKPGNLVAGTTVSLGFLQADGTTLCLQFIERRHHPRSRLWIIEDDIGLLGESK